MGPGFSGSRSRRSPVCKREAGDSASQPSSHTTIGKDGFDVTYRIFRIPSVAALLSYAAPGRRSGRERGGALPKDARACAGEAAATSYRRSKERRDGHDLRHLLASGPGRAPPPLLTKASFH